MPAGFWFYNFLYQRERERGLDAQEDLYSPFVLRFNIAQDSSAVVIASTSQHQVSEAPSLEQRETERRRKVMDTAPAH